MHLFTLALFNTPHISLPQGFTPTLQILLRWVHFMAGIIWVGLLYFFVLINNKFLQQLEASVRSKVIPLLMASAMWWFRWASVVTVFAGIWYWMMIVGADARNAQAHGGQAIGTFFGLWTLAFAVEMALLMSPLDFLRRGPVYSVIVALTVLGTSWLYLALNSHGWESNRLLAIGIGGGMGWFMMFNVWGIVWRVQKKMIRWNAELAANGTPIPPEAAKLSQLATLAARTNFVLSFPMLFMMAVASHYPMFVS
jgi:uncharacterized membrane protein